MPKGTKVHRMYEHLVAKGMSKGMAAATAQKRTGKSLRTGRKPKGR